MSTTKHSGKTIDTPARRMGHTPGRSIPSPSFPEDLEVIRGLSIGATIAHNFAVPQPSDNPDDLTDVVYDYICDGRALAHNKSAIVTNCFSKLLSINEVANSELEDLKGRLEAAVQRLNWKRINTNDTRPIYVQWTEKSRVEGSEESLGTMIIRLADESEPSKPILLEGTPQARLLRVWQQSAADGNADARWNGPAAPRRRDASEQEGSLTSAQTISITSSPPNNVDGTRTSVASGTLLESTQAATSEI